MFAPPAPACRSVHGPKKMGDLDFLPESATNVRAIRPITFSVVLRDSIASRTVEFLESSQRLVQPIEYQRGVDDLIQTMTRKVRS